MSLLYPRDTCYSLSKILPLAITVSGLGFRADKECLLFNVYLSLPRPLPYPPFPPPFPPPLPFYHL